MAVSYYFHLLKLRKIDSTTTFTTFLTQFNNGEFDDNGTWGAHVGSILKYQENILVIKYEMLLTDTLLELKRIINYCGINWDVSRAEKAINQASFSRMQRLDIQEHDEMPHLKKSRKDIRFIRSGKSGEYQRYFSEDQKRTFDDFHLGMLHQLGYEES